MATIGSDLAERAIVVGNGGVLEVEGRQMKVHHVEVVTMPGAVDASTRSRDTAHLMSCAQPSANVHARLITWSIHQLTGASIQEWEVEAAIRWLKAGTAPGEDGVTPDMVVAAGQPMRRVLMGLFNKCWKVGSLPSRWGKARVRMLHKRDSKHECTNYRGISLLDVMSKLYEKVLDHRMQALQAVVAPGKGVQPEQLGFSPNHRVEDAVHGLVEGVKHNRNDGNRVVILLSADVKKAYPSMPRGKMLEAVADMGVTGQLYLAIAATYDGNESVVLTSDEQVASGSYDVNDGLREGAVLLPRLYNIFMAGRLVSLGTGRAMKKPSHGWSAGLVRKPTKKHKDANIGR
jgi:hypothetical protein